MTRGLDVYHPNELINSFAQLIKPPAPGVQIVADSFYLGSSERVWKVPFSMRTKENFDPSDDVIDMSVHDIDVMLANGEFLQRYQPKLLQDMIPLLPQRSDDRPLRIAQYCAETAEMRSEEERGAARRSEQSAPRCIEVPVINQDHWAYKAHFNVGHGISIVNSEEERIGQSTYEAVTDTGAILDYIRAYAELAQNYSGDNLYRAVDCAAFRDPYYSCMEVCLLELKLPGHFIALIHYGIGVYKLTGITPSLLKSAESDGTPKAPERLGRDTALHGIAMEAFNLLTRFYLEDFDSTP